MENRIGVRACVLAGSLAILLAGSFCPAKAPTPSRQEADALKKLAEAYTGAMVYTRHGRVRKVTFGRWTPEDLGGGDYARWSPDGERIAVWYKGKVFVMKADGSGRVQVADGADRKDGCPIEFGHDGKSIIFWRRKGGFHRVGLSDRKVESMELPGTYSGAPCVSADGKRMAARWGRSLYAIDLVTRRHHKFGTGCSPNVSPGGKRLFRNDGQHRTGTITDWKGKVLGRCDARTCLPDRSWDNHHWTNLPDFIAAQGDRKVHEAYLFQLSANRGIRLTWEGQVGYPDVFLQPRESKAARNTAGDPA